MASRIGGLVGDQNLNIHFNEASQIPQQQTPIRNFTSQSLIGKRTLADFQAQQQMNISPALNRNSLLYLRSIKPRMYQHASPVEFASSANLPSPELLSLSQRHRVPLLQQLRPHPAIQSVNNHILSGVPNYMNALQNQYGGGARVDMGGQETENKMMNKLLELEKQLLDDNDEDAVSVITDANSEWSEIIQNLVNPISSPISSSSSSSASVTTPLPNFSKQTIVEAASTIYEGKSDVADEILSHLSQVSNPRGNSSQRFIGYMSTALKSCLHSAENPPTLAELYGQEHIASTLLLYRLSPCFELGIMAANLAILDSTIMQQPNRENGFHVIDFDIGQGCQYMKLLRALSERTNGNSTTVKLTAVTDYHSVDDQERLKAVGTTLCQLAEQLGVSLRFSVVSCKIGNLSRESLGCEPDEPLAVNFAFSLYRLPDESVSTDNPRDELLRRVKALAPQVVTLVEQEINTNTAPFLTRVNEVSSYYGALFESIESTMQSDNTDRVRVEKGLARKLANSVACEGRDRLERCEVFGKWRARMGMAGFESKPMSQNITDLIKGRLNNVNRVNPGFTIREESGGVSFGWLGKTLTVASAWR